VTVQVFRFSNQETNIRQDSRDLRFDRRDRRADVRDFYRDRHLCLS
jgi:hypothetical protein